MLERGRKVPESYTLSHDSDTKRTECLEERL